MVPDHLPRSSIAYRLRKTQGSLGMTMDELNELLDAELKHKFAEIRGDGYPAYSSVICETPCSKLDHYFFHFLKI